MFSIKPRLCWVPVQVLGLPDRITWEGHGQVDYAKFVLSCILQVAPNPALWSVWDGNASSIDHVLNADFNTTGPGAASLKRASWAVELTSSEAAEYSISSAVGSDWETWVDTSYFV
jgi:pectinesterase